MRRDRALLKQLEDIKLSKVSNAPRALVREFTTFETQIDSLVGSDRVFSKQYKVSLVSKLNQNIVEEMTSNGFIQTQRCVT